MNRSARHFPVSRARALQRCAVALGVALGMMGFGTGLMNTAHAAPNEGEPSVDDAIRAAVEMAREGGRLPDGARMEVIPGTLDARLRLAPCKKVQPYLPNGAAPWGRTRVGLRCLSGPVPWNVYLPVTVKVWAPVWTARNALSAGTPLQAEDLILAEADLAETPSPAHRTLTDLLGRQLAQSVPPGTVVRDMHLRTRTWFQAGEQVTIVITGAGFGATATGQALSQGLEGQPVRVRTEGGRVLVAWPVADNRVEMRQ